MKKDYRFEKVIGIFSDLKRGKMLDLGCSEGDYSHDLKMMGFDVTASDMDRDRFKYHGSVKFEDCDLRMPLPFADEAFDYVLFLEVIEHLRAPFAVMREISRILKPGGVLFLSTPNILNIGSRLRFLFEGGYDFFREPLLDYVKLGKHKLHSMHIIPWRYQELEYLLFENNLCVDNIYTDFVKSKLKIISLFLKPFLKLQCRLKEQRSLGKGEVNYGRINRVLFSDEVLLGRHLIVKARKGAARPVIQRCS